MPPDPLEMVGPWAHHVPWLVSTSRYATDYNRKVLMFINPPALFPTIH